MVSLTDVVFFSYNCDIPRISSIKRPRRLLHFETDGCEAY